MLATGRYQLLDRIAKGGMAELYRARVLGEEGFSKVLAVKRILPEYADDADFVGMLIDEARLAANLSHPNIVQVFELGRDEQGLFIAMEFVSGPNLAALLRRLGEEGRPLPEPCALDVAIQVLQGLDAAHRMTDAEGRPLGIVHRDVTPENVLLTSAGVVKLSDFGVAKAQRRVHETQAGAIKGKLPYMSPEQVCGKAVDARSDVFAAGLVLWECLAGRIHYDAPTDVGLMQQVAEARIRRLADAGVRVAPEIERALAKALAPDPERRYASAGDFARDLMVYHRRAWPAHGPEALGGLVDALFREQFRVLADRLRRFETGAEKPSGEAGGTRLALGGRTGARDDAAAKPTKLTKLVPAQAAVTKPARAAAERPPPSDEAGIDAALKAEGARERAARGGRGPGLALVLGAFVLAAGGGVGAVMLLEGGGAPAPAPSAPPDTDMRPLAPPPGAQPPSRPGAEAPRPAGVRPSEGERRGERREPKAAVAAAVEGGRTGLVDLECEPECEVEIDGRHAGFTPLKGVSLAAGAHRVRAFNRVLNLKRTFTLEVEPDKRTRRSINLVTGR